MDEFKKNMDLKKIKRLLLFIKIEECFVFMKINYLLQK